MRIAASVPPGQFYLSRLFFVAGAFVFASCFQEERDYILNPDGSGKVEFAVVAPLDQVIGFVAPKTPEEKAKANVARLLGDSEGVAAFADVSWEFKGDETMEIRGTAYFDDVNQVKLKMPSGDLAPVLARRGNRIVVECRPVSREDSAIQIDARGKNWEDFPKRDWEALTPEERDEALQAARRYLARVKSRVGVLSEMSSEITLRLPAPAGKVAGFEDVSGNSCRVRRTGKMLLERIDELLADEKALSAWVVSLSSREHEAIKAGEYEKFFRMLGGVPGHLSLDFAADAAPVFDYQKELAAARKATPAMLERLGLTGASGVPTTDPKGFESVRLTGLRIAVPASNRDLRVFDGASSGTTFAFLGEFSGAVLEARSGRIKSFVLNNGRNLGSKYPGSIRLSGDSKFVRFEIRSNIPPKPDATEIRRLEGDILCLTANATKTVDLGFGKIAVGRKGKRYGAKITAFGTYRDGRRNPKTVTLHLDIDGRLLKKVQFYDGKGVGIRRSRISCSRMGDGLDLVFACGKALPEDGAVKITVLDDLRLRRLPFVFENVPLFPVSEKPNR